jgi:hypothetical protein
MTVTAPESSGAMLLGRWQEWWATSGQAPAKMPHSLHVRTALHLLTRTVALDAGAAGGDVEDSTTGLLREWLRWWASTGRAPLEMPEALHLRTSLHLARHALNRFQAMEPAGGIMVCQLCFRMLYAARGTDVDYCDRCRRGYSPALDL